jgi:hypothetical protein
MSLTFTSPFLLFGLAAILLPILIHRIVQKKAVSRKFSAVRLLIESQKFTARPYQLKDLLLLMLRVLAVGTVVVLAAGPILLKGGPAAYTKAGVRLIILDNSLSMGYRDDSGVRFELARHAAREMIQGFAGQVAIVPTVFSKEQNREGSPVAWMGSADALRKLETMRLTFDQGDIDSTLSLATQALRGVNASKEIVLISDMARADWEGVKAGVPFGADVVVTLVRISGPQRDPNLTVRGVRITEGEAIVGARTRLEVTVSNLSDTSASPMTQLYIANTKTDQRSIELKAGEEGKIFFDIFLDKPGWTACEAKVSGDRLTTDDTFHFTLKARQKLPVLVVDGDPRTTPRTSESYYLASALRPGGSEAAPFSVRLTTDEEFARLDLTGYEALFLLNVASPQASRLASFMQSGKPLFVFLGDRVSREAYNALPFLAVKLREIRSFQTKPEHVAHVDATRGPLKLLAAKGQGTGHTGHTGHLLSGASFRNYYAVEGKARTLLAFGNGDPLLIETDVGTGKLYLFVSSADLDWNDLPLNAAYLPLIQGLLKEARGLPGSALPDPGTIGSPIRYSTGPSIVPAAGPFGPFKPFIDACRPVSAPMMEGAEGPGIYECSTPAGTLLRGFNPPFGESNLTKLSDGELKRKFGPVQVSVMTYDQSSGGSLAMGRRDLWPMLLAALLALLAAEMILAHLFSRSRSAAQREIVG